MQTIITVLFMIVPFLVLIELMLLLTYRAKIKKMDKTLQTLQKKVMRNDFSSLAAKLGKSFDEDELEALTEYL